MPEYLVVHQYQGERAYVGHSLGLVRNEANAKRWKDRQDANDCAEVFAQRAILNGSFTVEERGGEAEAALSLAAHRKAVLVKILSWFDLPPEASLEQLADAIASFKRRADPAWVPAHHLVALRQEVDCRIEHGAASGGHLEYVRDRLDAVLGLAPPAPAPVARPDLVRALVEKAAALEAVAFMMERGDPFEDIVDAADKPIREAVDACAYIEQAGGIDAVLGLAPPAPAPVAPPLAAGGE